MYVKRNLRRHFLFRAVRLWQQSRRLSHVSWQEMQFLSLVWVGCHCADTDSHSDSCKNGANDGGIPDNLFRNAADYGSYRKCICVYYLDSAQKSNGAGRTISNECVPDGLTQEKGAAFETNEGLLGTITLLDKSLVGLNKKEWIMKK